MEYINAIDKFLYEDASLNDLEASIVKEYIDNIVLLNNKEGKLFFYAIGKIVERGMYNDLIAQIEIHSSRKLNDPIDDLEKEEAGIH